MAAENQAMSLDDPIYSVMIGDQAIIITLANILEVAKLKNEVDMSQQRASELDVELTAAKQKLSVYWTKILEGHVIIGDFKRKLSEEEEIRKRLMKGLEQEIGWRDMIGVKHHLLGKFVKEMGREFIEIVGGLTGWLKKGKMEGGGGGDGEGDGRGKMEMEILRGIPVVLKGLQEKLDGGGGGVEVRKREEIIRNLGVMKGIIKTIGGGGGDLESTSAAYSEQGQEDGGGAPITASTVEKPPSTSEGDDESLDQFETYIEVVEDEDVPSAAGEELTTSGGGAGADPSDQIGEATSGANDEDTSGPPVKKVKRKQVASKISQRFQTNLKPMATCDTNAATTVTMTKHCAHPDNKRMCLCGFTTHVTNLNKHIWRLTEGRHTTRGHHICLKCGDRFNTKSALRKHEGAHTNGVPKKKAVKNLTAPARVTAPVPVPKARSSLSCTCVTCQRVFPNRRALKNHRRKTHYAGGSGVKTVVSKAKAVKVKATVVKKAIEKVELPQQLHEVDMGGGGGVSGFNGHVCKCGNQYFTRGALVAHIRKNTQQLQFKCHLCEQRFLWNSLLVQHYERSHKVVPPKSKVGEEGEGVEANGNGFSVSCSFCGAMFWKYDELYKHRKAVHGIGKKCF